MACVHEHHMATKSWTDIVRCFRVTLSYLKTMLCLIKFFFRCNHSHLSVKVAKHFIGEECLINKCYSFLWRYLSGGIHIKRTLELVGNVKKSKYIPLSSFVGVA